MISLPGAGTALPGGTYCAKYCANERHIQIGILGYYNGIVSTKL